MDEKQISENLTNLNHVVRNEVLAMEKSLVVIRKALRNFKNMIDNNSKKEK